MKRIFNLIVIAGLASQALVVGQGSDASKVLAMVRDALTPRAIRRRSAGTAYRGCVLHRAFR